MAADHQPTGTASPAGRSSAVSRGRCRTMRVKELLSEAGMKFVAAYDAFTKEPPKADSERIYVIAREGYQENKSYEYVEE